jgi:GAF domain-containing protein
MGTQSTFSTGPYDVILDTATAMVAGSSVETTLRAIVENSGRAMFAEAASLGSYDPERDEYVHEAEWHEGGLNTAHQGEIGRVVHPSEVADLRQQLEARHPVEYHIDDANLNEAHREFMTRRNLKTTLDCSLAYGAKVIGLVSVTESRFVRRFTPSETALFAQLCKLAAVGIHTARQAPLLEETQRQLQEARRGAGAPGLGAV